jgi:FkbM family methyltransferase
MKMFEQILDRQNLKKRDIQELKLSEYPLFMYGAGSYAEDLLKFLSKEGIVIDAAFVDDEYFASVSRNNNLFNTIFALNEVCEKYSRFNVIIGFSDYKLAKKKLTTYNQINKIFFIDAPFYVDFFDYQYICENKKAFEFTYNLLEDDDSKKLMVSFINAKINGRPDELYDFFNSKPYFINELKFNNEEIFVDCGAFDGDTVSLFVKKVNNLYKKIYALEIDELNYHKLLKNISLENIYNIHPLKIGSWDKKDVLYYKSDSIRTSLSNSESEQKIDVETIDCIVGDDPVSFIKMDIEGAELKSLLGAKNTITSNKPKLAICVYHRPEDLITIPQLLKKYVPEYKFYLRHHRLISMDTILYAVI